MLGVDTGTHFWLTNRGDTSADEFANTAGLEIVRYRAPDGNHTPALKAFFGDIVSFVPEEAQVAPITTNLVVPSDKIPSANDLASCDPEDIRTKLSAYAGHLVKGEQRAESEEYQSFLRTYKRSIHNAWFIDTEPPQNTFFGYDILSEIGSGSFSNVFEVVGKDGDKFALKLFRKELLFNQAMLDAFRRGVSSMRILATNKLPGMVRIEEATELPLAVFMEYVDGVTFENAVEAKQVDPWSDGLEMLVSAAKIVKSGHVLPQSVLHRDIRPSNIMVRNFYDIDHENEVVVLDFDLSWHQGAYELTLNEHSQGSLGYLAPEQIRKISKVSTRHTAVDVYGFSALVFFTFAGFHPYQGMFHRQDFSDQIGDLIPSSPPDSPMCLKHRVCRLILDGTAERQSERIDFSQLINELELLRNASVDFSSVEDPDFWAEEILACVSDGRSYLVDPKTGDFVQEFASGLSLSLSGDLLEGTVKGNLKFSDNGFLERKRVVKYLLSTVDRILAKLSKAGFTVPEQQGRWHGSFSVDIKIGVEQVRGRSQEIGRVFQELSSDLSFD